MTDEEGFSTKKKIEQVQVVIKESDETPSMKELFSLALTGAVKDMKTVAHKTLEKFDVTPKKIDVSDPAKTAKPAKPVAQKQPVMDAVPNKTAAPPEEIAHDWHKENLVTLTDKGGSYDKMVCRGCGAIKKCYGLERNLPEFGCKPPAKKVTEVKSGRKVEK